MSIAPESWRPVGVAKLEKGADDAVRSTGNCLVVAGPGAGKTELLAQRACYLLQTGINESPRRILAISFKRDAARNLRERVLQRCGPELASRFDSYTFDSFSKSLVDRFLMAIPQALRPRPDYRVLDSSIFNERKIRDFMQTVPTALCPLGDAARNALQSKTLYREGFLRALPTGDWPAPRHNEDIAGASLWNYMLKGGSGSALSFPMIGLVAELALRANPLIVSVLRSAYQHVFLDEFQDTTFVHYLLMRTAFRGSQTVLTAVGDSKQRIMIWAGALKNVFEVYSKDFAAATIPLVNNHRSRPHLIAVQAIFAKALDPNSPAAVCPTANDGNLGECRALEFNDEEGEAAHLAQLIAKWVNSGVPEREICILTRLRPAEYTQRLIADLSTKGIRARVENELQDLLTEPVVEAVLDVLKMSCRPSDPAAWTRSLALLRELSGHYDDAEMRILADGLGGSIDVLHSAIANDGGSAAEVKVIVNQAVECFGENRLRTHFPQYKQGTWFETQLDKLVGVLATARKSLGWSDAIDDIEGHGSVPIMTTHKSKGLEYHSVIFVGLEDGAHFSYATNPTEEQCGVFVALSRAKERVIFTFSGTRPNGFGGKMKAQSRTAIAEIYERLEEAGVKVETVVP